MSKFQRKTTKTVFYKNPKYLTISLGLFIILIMVMSVLTYSLFGSNDNTDAELEYNGYFFFNQGGIWYLNYNGLLFSFYYNPKELESLYNINFEYGPGKIIVAYDPEQLSEQSFEVNYLSSILDQGGLLVTTACIKESESCKETVACNNLNHIFVINQSAEETIEVKDNCYIFNTMNIKESKSITYLTFKILGIM